MNALDVESRSFVVTSAPPNPNGDLHLGHLSGPFLGADVMRRHLVQRGHDVRYVGYSDEHSCYVPRRGEELGGKSAYETAHVFGRRMENTLAMAGMRHDYFTRPLREQLHTDIVQRFFLELWDKGAFEVHELPVFHCADCDRHLYEAEVRGECQFCAAPSDGVYCEECGLPQEPAGLAAPRCTRCWTAPELRTLRRISFPLEAMRDALTEYYAQAQSKAEWRPRLKAYLETLLSGPLPLTPVSREDGYGIPVPLPGWEGHILDTWFSGIFGYVAATAGLTRAEGEPELWERLWSDPATEVINFIGFDCSFSHAVLWPALLLAHGGLTLPAQVVTNEFYRLEGDKFSTSRNHAIWGSEFLTQVSADALRMHLCLTGPELSQTNFAMKEFQDTVDRVLVNGLEQWVETVVRLVREDMGGVVPAADWTTGPLGGTTAKVADAVADALAPEHFSPQRAATLLAGAVSEAVADLPGLEAARSGDRAAYESRLATHLELLARFAAAAWAITPAWSSSLLDRLGIAPADAFRGTPPWPVGTGRFLPAGGRIADRVPVFFRPVDA
ncbi:class I tRNA ligase family protein [Streptomyces sp. CB03238]|uniref:class I tRNA ligase family protein n=1 Tax=Streptomyces sp. CB03238 TaxID=1907777 RepID=UPI0015C42D73|nr:class I tRNA ligase family protein [Streptomyces sp. CB03238]